MGSSLFKNSKDPPKWSGNMRDLIEHEQKQGNVPVLMELAVTDYKTIHAMTMHNFMKNK